MLPFTEIENKLVSAKREKERERRDPAPEGLSRVQRGSRTSRLWFGEKGPGEGTVGRRPRPGKTKWYKGH